ncbi:RHS repeat domain-containing protein [Streptomyces sp. NPDC001774]
MTRAVSPTGAATVVTYKPVEYVPGLTVVESVKTTDDNGGNILSERRFSMDVQGGDRRNYTGFPHYQGGDALFDAGDTDAAEYTYMTELSDGKSTVRSTYNKLHLLTRREVKLSTAGDGEGEGEGGGVTVQTQELHYAGEQDGRPPRPDDLPANYSKPVEATVTHTDPATGQDRTTRETARFDGHGRQTERTDVTGAKTVTVFDKRFGLPVKTTITGADNNMSVTDNTLSGDGKTVAESRTLVGKKDQKLTARTVTTSEHDQHGEVSSTTTGWAENARPEGDQGPEKTTETREVTVDTEKHTRTDTVTTAAGISTEVTDLVTGSAIATTGPAGRTVKTDYDAAGRPVRHTAPTAPAPGKDAPGELVTTTEYPSPVSVKTTGPDGHVTVETTDLLGRTVRKTDNIRDGEFTRDPAARTLQSTTYSEDGLTATVTDGAGRTTVTTNDALGRPVKTVAPNGMAQLTSYQDAAGNGTSTKRTAVMPAGETDPAKAVAVTTETSDGAGRPVASAVSYADSTPSAPSSRSFDGLGRVSQSLSEDVTAVPSYDGPGGTVQKTTLTPASPGTFPGEKTTADTRDDLTGRPVVKTLTPGTGAEGRAGITVVRDGAGRVTSERRQDGGQTAYTYTPGGQVRESVSPTGVKTGFTYEEETGRVLEAAVTSADGTAAQKTACTYARETGRVTEVYSPDDKPGTLISYTYDADGNVLEVAYPDGTSIAQTFGNHGQRTSLTDAAGAKTVYTYNPDGTLKTAVQHDRDPAAHEDARELARVAYTYDGLGRIETVVRGDRDSKDHITTAYTYAGLKQIRTEKTTGPGGKVITEAAYAYDAHGNLAHRTDTRPEAAAGGPDSGGALPLVKTQTAYRYDAYNRLLGSEVRDRQGAVLSSTAYTLNVSGDVTRTETTGPDGKKTGTVHTIDPAGRLTAVTTDGKRTEQTWDGEGNLLTDHRGTAYTYDLLSRPLTATAPDGHTTRYTYWADGSRATTTTGGGSTGGEASGTGSEQVTFHYTPDGTLANDTHASGKDGGGSGGRDGVLAVTASYLLAGTRHARSLTGDGAGPAAATGAGYLLQDRHGSTTALTGGDGTVRAAWNYTDYGQPAGYSGQALPAASRQGPAGAARNPFTYAGEYTSPDGTQYLRARIYDTAQGRFTTADPAPRFNRYQAFDANPVNNIDPTGNTEIPDWANWLLYGITLAAAVITTAVSFLTAGSGIGLAIAIAGAVLDGASMLLDTAARITGQTAVSDPLNIASIALGGAGFAAGTAAALGARALARTFGTALESETMAAHRKLVDIYGAELVHVQDFGDRSTRAFIREYARLPGQMHTQIMFSMKHNKDAGLWFASGYFSGRSFRPNAKSIWPHYSPADRAVTFTNNFGSFGRVAAHEAIHAWDYSLFGGTMSSSEGWLEVHASIAEKALKEHRVRHALTRERLEGYMLDPKETFAEAGASYILRQQGRPVGDSPLRLRQDILDAPNVRDFFRMLPDFAGPE